MNGQQKIELAIRAGHLAKTVLNLTSMSDVKLARMVLVEIVKELREVDDFLTKAAREG